MQTSIAVANGCQERAQKNRQEILRALVSGSFLVLDVNQSTVLVIPDTSTFLGKPIVSNERKKENVT
jgi:hypothetical protein